MLEIQHTAAANSESAKADAETAQSAAEYSGKQQQN
jgi:hypothetical protein